MILVQTYRYDPPLRVLRLPGGRGEGGGGGLRYFSDQWCENVSVLQAFYCFNKEGWPGCHSTNATDINNA